MSEKYPSKRRAEADLQQQEGESRLQWIERIGRRCHKRRLAKQELERVISGEVGEEETPYLDFKRDTPLTEVIPNQPFYRR
jgi:hypothetical protein